MTNQHLSKILVYQLLERTFWPKTWLQAHLKSCLQSNLVKGDESNVDNDGQNKSNGNNKNGDGDIDGKVLTLDYDESENDVAGSYLVWGKWLQHPGSSTKWLLGWSFANIDDTIPFLKIDNTLHHLVNSTLSVEFEVWSLGVLKNPSFEELPLGGPWRHIAITHQID